MRRAVVGPAVLAAITLAGCTGSSPATLGRSATPTAPQSSASAAPSQPVPSRSADAGEPRCSARSEAVRSKPQALLAIQFVNPDVGWVVTGRGVIATTDGGQSWHHQLDRRMRFGAQVDFIDRDHGWLVSDQSVLVTEDGGQHWAPLPAQCPAIGGVHFYSASDGYAVTGHRSPSGRWQAGPVLRTHDGGQSWAEVATPDDAQEICMTDADHGWLAAGGEIYRTVDGAQSWTLVEAGARHSHRYIPTATVQCSGPRDAWALIVGGAASSQQAHTAFHLRGRDSYPIYTERYFPHPGVHTDVESPGGYSGPFSAVSPSTAFFVDYCPACGSGTAPLAVTYDAGRTLVRRGDVPGLSQAAGASFVNDRQGWVVGGKELYRNGRHRGVRYRILRTDDGGQHWTTQRVTTVYDR